MAELNAVSDKYRHQNDDHGAQVAELCRIEDEIRARCQAETEEGERLRGKLAMQEIQAETQIRRLEEDKAALEKMECLLREGDDKQMAAAYKKRGAGGREQRIKWLLEGDERCRFIRDRSNSLGWSQ